MYPNEKTTRPTLTLQSLHLYDKDNSVIILLQSTVPLILMNMTFANSVPIHGTISLYK
jgi:hypothetical protein